MKCARPEKTCLHGFSMICTRKGYCKAFDLDGTPMGHEKMARNKEKQAALEKISCM